MELSHPISPVQPQAPLPTSAEPSETILRQQETYLRTVINNAPVILWATDQHGVFTLSEGKGLEKLGFCSGEAVGLSLFELYAHLPEVITALRRTLTTGEPYHVVAETQGRILEGRGNAFYDEAGNLLGMIGVSTDITERQQAEQVLADYNLKLEQQVYERTLALQQENAERQRVEETLRQQQNLLRQVIDSNPNFIFVKDWEGRYLLVNQAVADLYDTNVEALLYKSDLDFQLPAEAVAQFIQENRSVIETGESLFIPEERYVLSGEQDRWIQWQKVPLRLPGNDQTSVLGIGVDITERKRAEQEMAQAKAVAEAASKAKSAFLANMSHELRTPLNAILGFSQLLRQEANLSPEHLENLNLIYRSGEHLLNLINQVLDLSKIEAGRMPVNRSDFNLIRLLQDVVAMFSLTAREKGLTLELAVCPYLPPVICTDEMKLRQVLINLVSNAMKFTDQGRISVRVLEVALEATLGQPWLSFEVADTGMGISQTEVTQIFEAFTQTTQGQKKAEGTGLGLMISRQFIQLLGGEISVSSTPGQGTTFQFQIPVELPGSNQEAPEVPFLESLPPHLALSWRQLSTLGTSWLTAFRAAVVEGDLEVLRSLLTQLPPQQSELQGLLLNLVNQYQFETLLLLTEPATAV